MVLTPLDVTQSPLSPCASRVSSRGVHSSVCFILYVLRFSRVRGRKSPWWRNNADYRIDFSGASVFGRTSGNPDLLIQEATENA